MKIVHITKYFSGYGGIETYTRSVADAAVKSGYDVTIICAGKNKKITSGRKENVDVISIPETATIMNAPVTMPILSLLRRLKPDVIHLHVPNPWAELNAFAYKMLAPRTRLIVTYHSDVIPYSPLMKTLAVLRLIYLMPALGLLCDKIISTSKNYAEASLALKAAGNRLEIIPLGVNVDAFCPGVKKRGVFTFLFVGRLIPYKGLEYLLKACKILKLSKKKFRMRIVGVGKLRSGLMAMSSALGVKDAVHFLGDIGQKELVNEYRNCDVFVLPSVYRSEAFGTAQLEAMSSGKPVISTAIEGSGVDFANKNGVSGVVVKPRDEISLANAMMRFMDDKKMAVTMGADARKRVVSLFNEEKVSKLVLKTYESSGKA
jgi:glycosyltransferase involved in cell wall biosynthesis